MVGPHKNSVKNKQRDALKPVKTSKTKRTSKDVLSDVMPLQIEDEGPDFPRGGGSSLSCLEEEEIRAEVDAEFEAEQRDLKKNKNKRQRKNFVAEEDLASLFGEGITGKLPRFANRITLKNVSPGIELWGIISEVNEKDLVVGLPGGLRGLVRANEASDLVRENEIKDSESSFLCKTFYVGQLVSCIVLQVDDDKIEGKGKRKIWLSLRLALLHKSITFDGVQEGMVLTSYVKSIEDHGYIVHFGLSSFTGFLPRRSKGMMESLWTICLCIALSTIHYSPTFLQEMGWMWVTPGKCSDILCDNFLCGVGCYRKVMWHYSVTTILWYVWLERSKRILRVGKGIVTMFGNELGSISGHG